MDEAPENLQQLREEVAALRRRLRELEGIGAAHGQPEGHPAEGEESMRIIADSLGEGLLITDERDVVLYTNARMAELTGYCTEEIVGRPAYELFLPRADWKGMLRRDEQRIAGRAERYELQMQRKDGSRFWAEIRAMPYRNASGRIVGTLGVHTDITARKRAEVELRQSEERFRTVVESLGEGLLITDLDDIVLYMNSRLAQLTGYAAEEMVGKLAYEFLLPPERWPDLRERHRQRQRGSAEQYEIELRRRDGGLFWAEIRAVPYRDTSGTVIGTLGAITDISERKGAEERIRRSLAEKEVLLKEIHHRVKNNLQVVSSLLDLQSAHAKDEKTAVIFQDSRNRIRSMALIHEQLYRSTDLAHIDFSSYIEDLATKLFQSYGGHEQEIDLEVDADPVRLDVDRAIPCGFIINELVSNALKYAFVDGRRGRIRIELKTRGEELLLRVLDDGVGFPPEVDFRRSSSLGLRLVKLLVDQLMGDIDMDDGPGAGFTIAFPV